MGKHRETINATPATRTLLPTMPLRARYRMLKSQKLFPVASLKLPLAGLYSYELLKSRQKLCNRLFLKELRSQSSSRIQAVARLSAYSFQRLPEWAATQISSH